MLAHASSMATMSGRHFSILIFQVRNPEALRIEYLAGKSHSRARIPPGFLTPNLHPFSEPWATLASYFPRAACEQAWG